MPYAKAIRTTTWTTTYSLLCMTIHSCTTPISPSSMTSASL